ncbi:MAG: 50S ribosomal protein L35 [Clostridia bacterium]|nr:50S ribosomal protein L35 [Clostridia bacterium]
MHTSKTHSGAKKRFKITGSGKILRSHANKNHILNKKSRKRKRNLRKRALVDSSDMKRITNLIG